ncbi:MAG: hypothetical protein ACTIDY_11520, partial [Halomonadaceae bacterium]
DQPQNQVLRHIVQGATLITRIRQLTADIKTIKPYRTFNPCQSTIVFGPSVSRLFHAYNVTHLAPACLAIAMINLCYARFHARAPYLWV